MPTFWPARVPNDVLTSESYAVIIDVNKPANARQIAFSIERREKWLRGVVYKSASYPPMVIKEPAPTAVFIKKWSNIGIVVSKPGPSDLPTLPSTIWVETGRAIGEPTGAPASPTTTAARRAGIAIDDEERIIEEPLWTHNPVRRR